jgi:hypothetical protein
MVLMVAGIKGDTGLTGTDGANGLMVWLGNWNTRK